MGDETTQLVDLPSGHTLTLRTKPTFGMMLNLRAGGEDGALGAKLASFIVEWSFDEPISGEAVEALDMDDGIALFKAFNKDVLPLLQDSMKKILENSPPLSTPETFPPSG